MREATRHLRLAATAALVCLAAIVFLGCAKSKEPATPPAELMAGPFTDRSGGRAKGVDLSKPEYVLLYFGAHWCRPCHAFAPELAKFYTAKNTHGDFEVVFVSDGKSRREMIKYMRDVSMPWPALEYDPPASKKLMEKFGIGTIPSLVMLDRSGSVVADSYRGKKYVGPEGVLKDLVGKVRRLESARKRHERLKGGKKKDPEKENGGKRKPTVLSAEQVRAMYDLKGISKGPAGRVAVINEQFFAVGDVLEGNAKVIRITDRHVLIRIGEKTYQLQRSSEFGALP